MPELTTVPTFTFPQGDTFQGDINAEYPIEVKYYNGTIELCQNDNAICIGMDFVNALFKEVKKHLPEATAYLKNH